MIRFLQSSVYSLFILTGCRDYFKNEKIRIFMSIIAIPVGVIKYLILSLLSFVNNGDKENKEKECAVVTIVKNEERYLVEFADYYASLKCKLIIYDNGSSDDTEKICLDKKNIIYHKIEGKKRQIDAYNHALNNYRNKYRYMFFFDIDEFLYCKDLFLGKNICEIMDSYFDKRTAALGINWLIFGSNYLDDYPEKGVIDSFTKCSAYDFKDNMHVKCCVKPNRVIGFKDSHMAFPLLGYKCKNADGITIKGAMCKCPNNKDIVLHHYFLKNKKAFEQKVNKGLADRDQKRNIDEFDYFDRNEVINYNMVKLRDYLSNVK